MTEIRAVNHKLVLHATSEMIAINGREFPLHSIDRVVLWAVSQRNNGAYMGTTFTVKVGCGKDHAYFFEQSGSDNHRYESAAATFEAMTDLLRRDVIPRIADSIVATIGRGEKVVLGGVGSTVLEPRGIGTKSPLSRPVPWHRIIGTAFEFGMLRLQTRADGDDTTKHKLLIGMDQWNAVAIPAVVAQLAPRFAL